MLKVLQIVSFIVGVVFVFVAANAFLDGYIDLGFTSLVSAIFSGLLVWIFGHISKGE